MKTNLILLSGLLALAPVGHAQELPTYACVEPRCYPEAETQYYDMIAREWDTLPANIKQAALCIMETRDLTKSYENLMNVLMNVRQAAHAGNPYVPPDNCTQK